MIPLKHFRAIGNASANPDCYIHESLSCRVFVDCYSIRIDGKPGNTAIVPAEVLEEALAIHRDLKEDTP